MKCPMCGNAKMAAKEEPYQYDECGLRGVVLLGVTVHRCGNCGEEMPEIPAMAELHKALAGCVVRKPAPLSHQEFQFLRKYLGYSGSDFAKLLQVRKETLSRWETGAKPVSPMADRLIRLLVVQDKRIEDYSVSVLEEISDEPVSARPCWFSRSEGGWNPQTQPMSA